MMKFHRLLLFGFAISALAQQPADKPKKRLFIEDYIIGGAVGSSQTTNGSIYATASTVARNISLEATDGFIKSCQAVTVTNDKSAADYVLRPNKGSSTLYKKDGDVAFVSHAMVKVFNLVKDVCGYIKAHP